MSDQAVKLLSMLGIENDGGVRDEGVDVVLKRIVFVVTTRPGSYPAPFYSQYCFVSLYKGKVYKVWVGDIEKTYPDGVSLNAAILDAKLIAGVVQ